MKRCVFTLILMGALAGCSKEDVDHAKQSAKEAGQEIKKEVNEAGKEIKRGIENAGTEIKKEINDAKQRKKDGDTGK